MKLEKLSNYDLDVERLNAEIQKLEGKQYKTDTDRNLIRKNKSQIDEYEIIKHIHNKPNVVAMYYFKDYTSKVKLEGGKLDIDEQIQNTLNMVGVDIMVYTDEGRTHNVDLKVLNYNPKYNGSINPMYGMDNLLIQVEGVGEKYGWGNDDRKQTHILMIYVPQTSTIYKIRYRKLIRFMNDYIVYNGIESDDDDRLHIFPKYDSREVCISVPIAEIPNDVLTIEQIA